LSSLVSAPGGSAAVLVPGKVFLAGEYAVLEGGVAVLAAVSRYARGQYLPGLEPSSPLIALTMERTRTALGAMVATLPPGAALVDTTAFTQGHVKLGLGSSAAAAVAAAGAMFEDAGLSLGTHRELLYQVADAAHRAAQGGVGSGADVAVAVHGGFLQFCRPAAGVPVCSQLSAPPGLHMVVFWTGTAARTADLLRAVRRYADAEGASYQRVMDSLKAAAGQFAEAFAANDAHGAVVAAGVYGETLSALGRATNVPIVTPCFDRMAAFARGLGGAAKPSGAGGGDVGLAFFADAGSASEFTACCPENIAVLDLGLGVEGAHREREMVRGIGVTVP
jgi:phosphomevalonate kinase